MHPFLNFEFLRISFAVHGNNKAGEWCARFPDRFCNSYVHPRDRIRRLSARSLHTWMLFQITTAARNRDGGRRKKRDSISHNGVSGSIPPHTRRPANGSRRGLVGFPSYTPIACRFVVRIEKVRTGSRKSRFSRPPAAAAVVDICPRVRRAGPNRLLFRRQWSAKPIERTLGNRTAPRRSIAISVVRIRESGDVMTTWRVTPSWSRWNWVFPSDEVFSPR